MTIKYQYHKWTKHLEPKLVMICTRQLLDNNTVFIQLRRHSSQTKTESNPFYLRHTTGPSSCCVLSMTQCQYLNITKQNFIWWPCTVNCQHQINIYISIRNMIAHKIKTTVWCTYIPKMKAGTTGQVHHMVILWTEMCTSWHVLVKGRGFIRSTRSIDQGVVRIKWGCSSIPSMRLSRSTTYRRNRTIYQTLPIKLTLTTVLFFCGELLQEILKRFGVLKTLVLVETSWDPIFKGSVLEPKTLGLSLGPQSQGLGLEKLRPFSRWCWNSISHSTMAKSNFTT